MEDKRAHEKNAKALRARAEETLAQTRQNIAAMPTEDVQELVHQLQVHQIELEMQNEELRRTELDLQTSRDRYLDLYDFAPVGYFTFGRDGEIHQVNLAGARLLGVERSRLVPARWRF
jgi:PAS domain-containing protein